ncbi:DNA-directed RNA polymerase III subunit RPC7-like [Dendronephthya gigantea]|uniref:DNA-directed RNA polymerase III subunit RPC7-like n=1 Tax=Dendronephthya gigantea TaxID=151771 RepID=UPI00106ABC1B|nr:DNA-directed RNA polymerase III subunit RPC7-like [Dendronephthya gigantea]
MAGRGRGRGKFTFDVAKIGFQKGEALPASIQQPPPLFPPLEFKPLPLENSESDVYKLGLKREYREIIQKSAYFVEPVAVKKDVERYTDKYRQQKPENEANWEPDWNSLPEELKQRTRKIRSSAKPNLNRARTGHAGEKIADVAKHLDELAKKTEGEEEEDDEEEVEEGGEEPEYDEIEQEEDNDYLVSHYDDGEEVGFQDDDDMDEGPIY